MTSMMRAAVFHGKRDIRVEDRQIPEIGPDDVLLKSRMVSICGSDVQPYVEGTGGVPGEIFGHEYVAEIAAVGSNVKKYRIGQRVFGNNAAVCGNCWHCKHGDPTHCVNALQYYTGKHLKHPGGMAEYFVFSHPGEPIPESPHLNSLMVIPDSMPDKAACLIEPFGVAIAAVEKCDVKAEDTVVILGCGAIGICALQWVKHIGAETIMVDISEERMECARACGADYVIDNSNRDCYEQIAKITGEIGWVKGKDTTPVRVVMDCAGYPGSLNDALRIVRAGGVILEMADSSVLSPVNITYISYKDISIYNSAACDSQKAFDGLRDGTLHAEPLISGIVPLERVSEAFELQAHGKALKILIQMNR